MTGELVKTALSKNIANEKQKFLDRIYFAWLRVPQRFGQFIENAIWYSRASCLIHPTQFRISDEMLAQICEEYANMISRRPS